MSSPIICKPETFLIRRVTDCPTCRPVAWHLVLADVVRLTPMVETRGYLRVPWPLPEDVAAKVAEATR